MLWRQQDCAVVPLEGISALFSKIAKDGHVLLDEKEKENPCRWRGFVFMMMFTYSHRTSGVEHDKLYSPILLVCSAK